MVVVYQHSNVYYLCIIMNTKLAKFPCKCRFDTYTYYIIKLASVSQNIFSPYMLKFKVVK